MQKSRKLKSDLGLAWLFFLVPDLLTDQLIITASALKFLHLSKTIFERSLANKRPFLSISYNYSYTSVRNGTWFAISVHLKDLSKAG